ncbi:MAG: hypothetical protein LBM27_04855 [Lactobacillaceae bacterium]|nr:hypothetical protein [Lactobacillaceae bacterium]
MTKEEATLAAIEQLKRMYKESLRIKEEGMSAVYGINPYANTVDKQYNVVRKHGKIVSINGHPVSAINLDPNH